MCPRMWCTGMNGLPIANASDLAKFAPTSSAPISPGAQVDRDRVHLMLIVMLRVPRAPARVTRDDRLHVAARGDLGHDAAVERVRRDLRVDNVRQHFPSVLDDGCRRLVARGLDCKYSQGFHSSLQVFLKAEAVFSACRAAVIVDHMIAVFCVERCAVRSRARGLQNGVREAVRPRCPVRAPQ